MSKTLVVRCNGSERRGNPTALVLEAKNYFFEFSGSRKVDVRRPVYQQRLVIGANTSDECVTVR